MNDFEIKNEMNEIKSLLTNISSSIEEIKSSININKKNEDTTLNSFITYSLKDTKDTKDKNDSLCEVEAAIYPEDCEYNGKEESESDPYMFGTTKFGSKFEGWVWKFKLDVSNGKIIGWPEGSTAKTYYKVVDCFYCKFKDKMYDGYVPDCFSIRESGYGDYMYLDIQSDGTIKDWNLNEFMKFYDKEMSFNY